jgi:Domain of unknown function (DUF6285)
MSDLPTAPALLALARDVLLKELLPLLPQDAHLDARLVANSMAIAEREAAVGDGPHAAILRELRRLYSDCSEADRPHNGEVEAETEEFALLRRFAQDLRTGAFDAPEQRGRPARDILWQLTIERLRLANPRFLNANGFS